MNPLPRSISLLFLSAMAFFQSLGSVSAANDVWTGSGANTRWTNPLNWGVAAPSPGDFLFWGSGQTTASNDFPAGTVFGNIQFNSGAASFTLTGNQILLTNLYDIAGGLVLLPDAAFGSISNLSSSAQFVALPVELMHGYHFIATTNGNLGINGLITRDTGAVITFYTSGSGAINLNGSGLTTNNFNNLLGGWAVLNDTNWATVDANSNVVAFTNYTYSDTVTTDPTLNYNTLGIAPVIAAGGATINSLRITNLTAGTVAFSAAGDTLRLGQNGGIMLANTVNGANWNIGTSAGSGIITAGSSGDSELFICEADPVSSLAGQLTVNSKITDNGSGRVTVVKNGGQNLVFGATNTYTGGTYINQSRIAPTFAGAMGFGPIFVNNGGQFWARANINFTNDLFLSGSGNGESQQFGAVRLNGNAGCILSGIIHVNVATPKISNSGTLSGQITGSAGIRISSARASGTSPTIIGVGNTANNYAGDTIIWADGFNCFMRLNNSEVIPNGAGAGNVIMTNTGNRAILDLNGFNETINGLISSGTVANDFVTNNNGAAFPTLTIGDNNATATFGGNIGVGNGRVALTKIGSGTETLTGANSYTGQTTVGGGTLILTGSGSISASTNVALSGGTLDVSRLTANATNVVLQGVAMTNGALTVTLNPLATNVNATSLSVGGTSNVINIFGVTGLSGTAYPTQFTVVNYSGTLSGVTNFIFGSVPSPTTLGTITNDGSRLLIVLTNGPKPLAWKGNDPVHPTFWDVATTTNWLFAGSDLPFNIADSVAFSDTASNFNVNVTTTVTPGAITVTNVTQNYVFSGAGNITGTGGLTKQGAATLTLLESNDNFNGGVTVGGGSVLFVGNNTISGGVTVAAGGTVQVGTNGGTGTLPAGNVVNNGSLLFNRGTNLTIPAVISGAGAITNNSAGVLTLGGANTFTGPLAVLQGTLQMGSATALGATNSGTFVSSGATLDVNSFSAGAEPVIVAGTGVGNKGAIINSGAEQDNAVRFVTLANDATFGGVGRWDIRSANVLDASQGSLLTGGQPYNLTKTGSNQVSLVGITVDPALGNINVQQGLFSVESAITGLGDPTKTLTVSSGATLQLFQLTGSLNKIIVLNGDGVTPSILEGSGTGNIINTVTLNGNVVLSVTGTKLNLSSTVTGTGGVLKTGPSQLSFLNNVNYSGTTVVSNGILVVDSFKSGGAGITVITNAQLAGGGTISSENITLNGGGISPGNPSVLPQATLTINGNVAMNSSSNTFDLTVDNTTGNDLLSINGSLNMTGTNVFRIRVVDHLNVGTIYTLVNYSSGSNVDTNHIVIVPPPFGYAFQLVDPTTTPGQIRIQVTLAIGFDFWLGNSVVNPTNWDQGTMTNWFRNGAVAFSSNDFACFSDQAGLPVVVSSTNINLSGDLTIAGLIFTNGHLNYKLTGPGRLTGSGALILEGGDDGSGNPFPTVTIANSGSNDFTGGGLIDANLDQFNLSTLIVGDGGTNQGNLGTGILTNDSILVFNHGGGYTNAVVINNNIVNGPDSGLFTQFGIPVQGITNMGSGVVVLAGNSTFTNELDVLNGILAAGTDAAGSGTAFGSTNPAALVIATNGIGTVDANGHNLGAKQVLVRGTGLNGQGALINNGAQQINAFQSVTLAGDTTFGGGAQFVGGTNTFATEPALAGTNRWDIRGGLATLATLPPGRPYNITKMGGNQVSLVGITNIDPAISNIDIQGGSFAIQTTTVQLGDPNGTITVHTNAALNVFALTGGPVNKNILIHGGGTYWPASGTSTNAGTITLGTNAADICIFQTDGNLWITTNPIVGPGSLETTNGGTLFLASSNGYAGNTILHGGTVTLVGTTFANSPIIDMSPASNGVTTVDVTQSGGTLTLNSGQTLLGNGTIRGSLVVSAGATVAPGHSIGTLNVTTNVTLNGQTTMELNAGAVVSDQINCTNTITYGGTLTVTNINGSLAAGQSFRLFRAGTYAGAFGSVTLPTLSAPLYWTNTLTLNGTIAVASTVIPQPVVTSITLNGLNATINATNGSPGGTFYVLSSTNVTLPLSNWTGLATNTFDGSGNIVNYTVTNGVAGPQRFFILQLP